jgi:FkbM family methyltransferase
MRSLIFSVFCKVFPVLYGTRAARLIWRVPGAHTFYRWLMPRIRPAEVLVDGHRIRLDEMDSLLLSVNGSYEAVEQALFVSCLRPGDVVLDIGAHVGVYTLQAARAVGPEGHVHAFEPSATTFALLEQNIALNGYLNVTAARAAVSASAGDADLTLSVDNTGDNSLLAEQTSGRRTERVETVTIDDYLAGRSRVDVVKMDVQGAEPAALAGAAATLAANESLILFTELSPAHLVDWGGLEDYTRALADIGFEFFEILDDRGVLPRTAGELAARQGDSTAVFWNVVCVKGSDALDRFRSATRTLRPS